MTKRSSESGFTLIELLIVIVIIGILASVVLSVINPARQRQRANEAVLRANTNKICLAMFACAAATGTAASCDAADMSEIGINPIPNAPAGATYGMALAGVNQDLTVTGTLGTCVVTCVHTFAGANAGLSTNLAAVGCLP